MTLCIDGQGHRTDHEAQGWLFTPEGEANTQMCARHAAEVIAEYGEKLDQAWGFMPYTAEKEPRDIQYEEHQITKVIMLLDLRKEEVILSLFGDSALDYINEWRKRDLGTFWDHLELENRHRVIQLADRTYGERF